MSIPYTMSVNDILVSREIVPIMGRLVILLAFLDNAIIVHLLCTLSDYQGNYLVYLFFELYQNNVFQ